MSKRQEPCNPPRTMGAKCCIPESTSPTSDRGSPWSQASSRNSASASSASSAEVGVANLVGSSHSKKNLIASSYRITVLGCSCNDLSVPAARLLRCLSFLVPPARIAGSRVLTAIGWARRPDSAPTARRCRTGGTRTPAATSNSGSEHDATSATRICPCRPRRCKPENHRDGGSDMQCSLHTLLAT